MLTPLRSNNLPGNVVLLDEVYDDLKRLDRSQQIPVMKAIIKTAQDPAPKPDGYGNPLSGNLAGFCKIKLRDAGIRVIYRYLKRAEGMLVVVVEMRADNEAYEIAAHRIEKHRDLFSDL